MNLISKIIAGVYYQTCKGEKKELSGVDFFITKLAMTTPFALLGIFIIHKIGGMINEETYSFLPNNKLSSFLFLLLFYPVVHFLTGKKKEILSFIEQTDEEELNKYHWFFVYIVLISVALFIIGVLVFK